MQAHHPVAGRTPRTPALVGAASGRLPLRTPRPAHPNIAAATRPPAARRCAPRPRAGHPPDRACCTLQGRAARDAGRWSPATPRPAVGRAVGQASHARQPAAAFPGAGPRSLARTAGRAAQCATAEARIRRSPPAAARRRVARPTCSAAAPAPAATSSRTRKRARTIPTFGNHAPNHPNEAPAAHYPQFGV